MSTAPQDASTAPAASTATTAAPSSVDSFGSEAELSIPPSPRAPGSPRAQLADVPEERSTKGNGDVEEEESRTTYRGSVQGGAAPPPLSRIASESEGRPAGRRCIQLHAVPPSSLICPGLPTRLLLVLLTGSMHSVHLRDLPPGDLFTISRLRMTSRDLEELPPPPTRAAPATVRAQLLLGAGPRHRLCLPPACAAGASGPPPSPPCPALLCLPDPPSPCPLARLLACRPQARALRWYLGWALPGLGMFVEAWLVFAIGANE